MIRSAKEAREAIKAWDDICDECAHKEIAIPDDDETTKKQMVHLISKGYLAALEGPDVMALVEALEKLQIFCELHLGKFQDYSYTALAQYREAVKP